MASSLMADVLDLVGETGLLQRGYNGFAEVSGRLAKRGGARTARRAREAPGLSPGTL